ncbi:MAG: MerR family transcriptional regulator [Candidatus Baltobacteraceae bacterium]
MKNGRLYQAKEFAAKTGTTVRTLHFYDRQGLLKPADRSGSGYRLYGEAELERLEQILALRFVGFKLEHIRELFRGPVRPLAAALRLQREIIEQQKRQLETAIHAIEQAERAFALGESQGRWETLRAIMGI